MKLRTAILSISVIALFSFSFLSLVVADPIQEKNTQKSFLPTWKLLSSQEKQIFIAGYFQGWKDAARVTDIAIEYVKTNPSEAIDGLERLKELYDLKGVRPHPIAEQVDLFYADPRNASAPLSVAITAAKQRVDQR